MKQITINLYNYAELSPIAKKRALADWKDNDDPFLEAHLENLTKEKLEERGYKADDEHVQVFYDLSYSQGDHFYFTGNITKEGHMYHVSQQDAGYTTYITSRGENSDDIDAPQSVLDDVKEISREMKHIAYKEIEYQQSEESFIENCEANEYTFEENGNMRNITL